MTHYLGITFAVVALFGWGAGDFLIQRTARLLGSSKALFFIGTTGLLGLLPLVADDLMKLTGNAVTFLVFLGIVVVVVTTLDFEALRKGKIAIIEPVVGLELPITVGLSVVLAGETLSLAQIGIILLVFMGILMAVTSQPIAWKARNRAFEKGVVLALISAIGMAFTNVLVGISSQDISPFVTIWFTHSMLAVVCGLYIIGKGNARSLSVDIMQRPRLILGQSILDNVAWVSFAKATTLVPIAIATTISESYIALAVLLGVFINKEKLSRHQVTGVGLTIVGISVLSYMS